MYRRFERRQLKTINIFSMKRDVDYNIYIKRWIVFLRANSHCHSEKITTCQRYLNLSRESYALTEKLIHNFQDSNVEKLNALFFI